MSDDEMNVPEFKVPENTETEDTSASSLISLQKSAWMLLQSGLGFAVSIAAVKIQANIGIPIPQDLQAGAIAAIMVVATSIIHGVSNFVKHKLADAKATKTATVAK